MEREYLELEPIGLVFMVFFAFVLVIQVTGMLLHRWGTISHIISDTKLDWCNKKVRVIRVITPINRQYSSKMANISRRYLMAAKMENY